MFYLLQNLFLLQNYLLLFLEEFYLLLVFFQLALFYQLKQITTLLLQRIFVLWFRTRDRILNTIVLKILGCINIL